ncbi:MAG: hypothetical protein NC548_31500 [Lachnospiraceae bacterium]|nr:hypothetical protein [Lachnospiraceae bacterium]
MQISMFRTDLPEWAKKHMMLECRYCGAMIVDNGDTGVTTARMCPRKTCPGHMQYKMSFVADFFHVKNFGPKSALNYINAHKCSNHLEILKDWYPEERPLVSLADVAVLACIDGYGSTLANKELNSYSSFGHYFSNIQRANPLLRVNMEFLLECETYFNIKPPLSTKQMFVMGTGSFNNYSSREEFFEEINDAFGQYIHVIQTGKRKTGVSYLIKEKNAVDHSKSQVAKECGIPIVTPAEFFAIMQSLCHI